MVSPLNSVRDAGGLTGGQKDDQLARSDSRGALSGGRGLSSALSRDLLDQATDRLLKGLEGAPYTAQAAAMLQGFHPGSFPGSLGRGMEARLNTQLALRTKPYELAELRARSLNEQANARQTDLVNRINELNLGYMTEPWDLSAPDGGGQASLLGGAGDDQGLPLTPASQERMALLQAQYSRALQYANSAPQARSDLSALTEAMTKVVAEDPLAKQALANLNTRFNANVDVDKQIKQKIIDIGKESFEAAQSELQSLASAPNFTVDLSDPGKINRWIDSRAKEVFAQRYSMLRKQLEGIGIDPDRYTAELEQAGAQIAEQQGAVPSPGEGFAAGASAGPAGAAAAPPAPAAQLPVATPGVTPLAAPVAAPVEASVNAPQAGPAPEPAAAPAPVADPGNPFIRRPPTTGDRLDLNKEQNTSAASLNTLLSGYNDLSHALELNQNAIEGPTADVETWIRRGAAGLHHLLGDEKYDDEKLNNTSVLNSILSSQTLQNLNTLIKGNPTEGERQYVERLGAVLQMSRGERTRLIRRVIQLLKPRITFERMRSDALANGTYVPADSYEEWLRQSYGPTQANRIISGDVPLDQGE